MAFICNDTSTTEIYTYCHTLSLHDALPICLELPAGLVGDETTDEAPEVSAARELEEETGYRAGKIDNLGFFYASPGMVSDGFTLVRAHGLPQVGPGGGDSDEQIVVHRVPTATTAELPAPPPAAEPPPPPP